MNEINLRKITILDLGASYMANPFVGREKELKQLNDLLGKKVSSLVVIRGRRRIGKSRLIKEFASGKKYYEFTALPPTENTTKQSQLNEFSRQLAKQTELPEVVVDDWSKLFDLLASKVEKGRVIILFDEISWMGSKDPDFLGKLKNAWDLKFSKNPQLILVLCGSVSSWIQKNIISSTGFLGRISLKLTIEELPLKDCGRLLDQIGFERSISEKYLILSMTGGVPRYIELIHANYSALENIKRLGFKKDGILTDEFKFIFHDLFGRRGEICKRIVEFLAQGSAEFDVIAKELDYYSGGSLSEYLEDLIISGFICRDFTWSLKSGKESTRTSKYRLSDNYVRFYLKYIYPKLNQINKNQFDDVSLVSLPNWDGVMGLQFENLVLSNRKEIYRLLNIRAEEIVMENPYFQHKTKAQAGCQIDYLIQTRYGTLFVCEIKFLRKEVDLSIIQSVKDKIEKMKTPSGFACLPVLIHVNGVSEEVVNEGYFFKIIDFSELLNE